MILTIARREIVDTWREGRVRIGAGFLMALLLLSLAVGIQHWRTAQSAHDTAQARDAEIWRAQGRVNPHSAAHFGQYAFKDAGPLAFVDEGINPYVGSAVWLEAHTQTPARARPAEDAAFVPVFGELTAALVLQMLVPLLIVLVAFAAFSGERENGTFRQVLSTGVRRRSLVLGKALGLTVALSVVLLPLLLIGTAALALNTSDHGNGNADVSRLPVLGLAYLLYFGAWVGVTLAVSAAARSSRQALVVLLGLWLVASLLVPRLAVDLADRVAPVPSLLAFKQAISEDMKKGISGHDPEDVRLEPIKQKLFKQYGVTRIQDLPINFDGVELAEGERYGNEVLDRQYARLWSIYERQGTIQGFFATLSPLVALRPLSMTLAGTDLMTHRQFTEAAEQHRRAFIKQLNDYHTANGKFDDWSFTAGPDLWSMAPAFSHEGSALIPALRPQAGNFAILGVWFAVAWALALLAVRRASTEASV